MLAQKKCRDQDLSLPRIAIGLQAVQFSAIQSGSEAEKWCFPYITVNFSSSQM